MSEERDPSQGWFWTAAWRVMEAEADADIAEGRVERFETAEEFLEELG